MRIVELHTQVTATDRAVASARLIHARSGESRNVSLTLQSQQGSWEVSSASEH